MASTANAATARSTSRLATLLPAPAAGWVTPGIAPAVSSTIASVLLQAGGGAQPLAVRRQPHRVLLQGTLPAAGDPGQRGHPGHPHGGSQQVQNRCQPGLPHAPPAGDHGIRCPHEPPCPPV